MKMIITKVQTIQAARLNRHEVNVYYGHCCGAEIYAFKTSRYFDVYSIIEIPDYSVVAHVNGIVRIEFDVRKAIILADAWEVKEGFQHGVSVDQIFQAL